MFMQILILAVIVVLWFSCILWSIKVKHLANHIMVIYHNNTLQTTLSFMWVKKREDQVGKSIQENALPCPD